MKAQYTCYLEIIGVGYRATAESNNTLLRLKLGLSHDVVFKAPKGVRVFCFKPTLVCCTGIDKQSLTQFVAKIRASKPPEIYKGKGIRFRNETILLKQGKKK